MPRRPCTTTRNCSIRRRARNAPAAGREAVYSEALDQLCRLHALIRKGRAYLQTRLGDPELAPETDTGIAAWLGHAWQLRELKEAGLVEENVELVQLAFHSYDDVARKEYVDAGVWMNLGNGRIYLTQTFRPYQAARHIKSDDSFSQVAQIKELCVYPGDINPRVRWDGMLARPIEPRDLAKVRGHGRGEFAAVVKEVKSVLKNPLADKYPICALNYRRIGAVGKALVVEDRTGERLVITDAGLPEEPRSSHLLSLVPKDVLQDQTLIVRFRHDLDSRKLQVKPLTHRDRGRRDSLDVIAPSSHPAHRSRTSRPHEHSRPDPGLRRGAAAGDCRQRRRARGFSPQEARAAAGAGRPEGAGVREGRRGREAARREQRADLRRRRSWSWPRW